jgi:hypothetical protein
MSLAGGGVDTDPLAVDPQQQELEDENPLLLLSEDVDLDHIMEEDIAGGDNRFEGGSRNRSAKCEKCHGCLRPECKRCAACLENLCFGGGKRRRYKRQNCIGKIYFWNSYA